MPGKGGWGPAEKDLILNIPGIDIRPRGDGTVDVTLPDGTLISAPSMDALRKMEYFKFPERKKSDMSMGPLPGWSQQQNTFLPNSGTPYVSSAPSSLEKVEKLLEDMAAKVERMNIEMQVMHTRMTTAEANQTHSQAILSNEIEQLKQKVESITRERDDLAEHNSNLIEQHQIITEELEAAEDRISELEREKADYPKITMNKKLAGASAITPNDIHISMPSGTNPAVAGRIIADQVRQSGWL